MRCVRPLQGRPPLGEGRKDRVASKLVFQPLYSNNGQSLAQRAFQCSSRGVHIVSWASALQHLSIGCSISMSVPDATHPQRVVPYTYLAGHRFRISVDDLLCRSRGRWGPNFNVDEQLSLSVVLALACSANVTQVAAIETAVSETVIFASSACDFNISNFGPYGVADQTFCQ